jgi:3-deoxy-D-manno-octulosonate 8-phosphate phosphatase (KDO 8-P phosphatase)
MMLQDSLPALPPESAKAIRLVVFDVDGVLTDGGVYLGASSDGTPVELKRFDLQDGLGMKMLVWAGLEVVMVSGRVSEASRLRAGELGLRCFQDEGAQKLPVLERLLAEHDLIWSQVAMVADDLPDLAVFSRVGLPVAVANAQPEITDLSVWQTRARGGQGAVREFCRALLMARGEWENSVKRYVEARGGLG